MTLVAQGDHFICPPELSLAEMENKRGEIWTLLLTEGTGGCSVLHVFAGGRCHHTFTGRRASLLAIAAQYEPAPTYVGSGVCTKCGWCEAHGRKCEPHGRNQSTASPARTWANEERTLCSACE